MTTAAERRHRRETDSWVKNHWRPMMAWSYLIICLFDFLAAPIFFAWFSYFTKTALVHWLPLTLQGGGMYHIAMGAIVGVTSWQKSQERIRGPGYQQYDQTYDPYNSGYGSGNYRRPYHQPHQMSYGPIPRRTSFIRPMGPDPEI